MSQTIDSRVVEMKFDNKNFEKNVAESMKTLDSLSKRLDNLENTQVNLDKVGRAADSLDLQKIDKALDSITHRFSVMGQIGASVLQNLTTDAYNLAKGLTSKVWGTVFGQMKTGGKARAENVENAKFLLEGMGITYDKSVEDQISDAVADTAFGFDEAAMAMAQLSGASVQLGDDMDKALKAISGVAAMTNRSFSDIADIFVDAAATGKVSADAFNRLSERGLAAKGIMQEFYGVTAEELDKLAKKGAISFNDFSKAMYDAFGTQAKKSNETLSGVIANTKAVLSRMGQSFYQPLMANNSDVVKMFQSLKDVMKKFEGPVKELGAQLSGYVLQIARYGKNLLDNIDVSKYMPIFENFKKVFENLYFAAQNLYSNILKPFGKQFKAALFEVFPSLNTGKGLLVTISDKILELSERFRKFTSEIGLFGEKGISVRDTLVAIFNTLKLGVKILKTASEVLKVVIKAISKGLGSINFSGMLANFTNFIAEAGEIGLFIISGITVGLTSAIPLLFNAISNVGNAIISAFCSFFGIASPSTVMRDKVGYWLVAGIAEGIKSALKAGLITGAILLVTGLILSTFKKEGESVIDVASMLFDGFVDKIGGVVNRISKWFGDSSFGKAFNATFETIAVVMTKLSKAITTFNVERAKELVGVIKQFVMLGTYVYLLIQFAAASTMFTSALFKISRAADAFVRNYRIKYLGATLKNLAIAIGIVVGSVLLFAGMIEGGHGDALLKGLIAVGGIITALVVAIRMIQGVVKSENVDPHGLIKVEAMFLGLGAAIYLIASAIRKVGRLDLPNLIAGTVTIGMFLFAITGLMLAVKAVSSQLPKDSAGIDQNVWIPLLGIAVAIRIIAGAISKVARIDVDKVWRAAIIVGALTAVVGGITLLSQLITTLDTGGGSHKILGVALMVIALGFAIKSITTAMVLLSYVPEELIQQGIETMRKIMGWLTALLFFSWFAQKTLGSILLGFAATVVSIAGSIWLIGQMKEGLAQGISSVIGILTIITVFIGAVNVVNKATGGGGLNSGTKSLLYVAACIAAMGAVVYAAGQLSWGQIGKGLAVVTVLTGFAVAVGLLFGMLSGDVTGPKAKGLKAFKNGGANIAKSLRTIMIMKTVVNQLIKLAAVAVVLAKIPLSEDEITKSMLMLAGVMGVLTVLILAAGAATDKFPNVQKITKPLIALTAAVAIIAGALVIMGQMESPATVITSAAAISVILLAMGKVLEKAKVFGVQGMSTKGIAAAALLIVGIGAALTLMIAAIGEFSLNKLGTVALAVGALSAVLLAIAAAMKIADKTQVSMKSAGAIILGSLSLVVIAATIALFASYVDDMDKATRAAVILSGVFLVIGVTLKIAESVHWSVAGGILLASLTFVAIAASVAVLASYMDDLKRADEAAWILAGLMVTLGAVLAVLAAISAGTGGAGAALILAIAGAMAIAGLAMVELAAAVAIAVYALEQLIAILTPNNASQVVAFFETIGDGIGTAGQHIADGVKTAAIAIHDAVTTIKEETGHIGFDFIDGFAKGISKFSPIVGIAAAAVGLLSLSSLRNAIDSHSKSKETYDIGYDYDDGLAKGIDDYSDMPKNAAQNVGTGILDNLKNTLIDGLKSTNLADIGEGLKKSFGDWDWGKTIKLFTTPKGMATGINTVWKGIGSAFGKNAVEGVQNGIQQATTSEQGSGNGLMDMFTGLFGGLTSGNFDNVLGGFDWTTILGGDGISGLKDYLSEAGVSMDNLSGDNIPKLIEQLKGAGLAGDDLINALKELGITEEQLQNLGLADKLGLDTAKEGAEELKTTIEDLADEIIKGKFGNAPERWDRMFEALIKSGKTAEEAYAAIADAQNEVNKRLGSSVVHTADEMEKKVSDSAKKAAGAASKATGKPAKDFTKEPNKAVTDITKADAKSSAEEQMKNNMPYANYLATKEQQITGEREKQTAEVYKQKLANEHMYTLKEKEQALAGLKANQELAANATLSTEKQKQLDAENKKYQAVVDTYNKQQDMLKVIQDQEAATKKAEDAEKKRGDAIKNSSNAVTYGSKAYEDQKKGTTINNRKTIVKQETKPVQAETKVEVTPKFELKSVDVTSLKNGIINKVETEIKDLNAKAQITPKIDISKAESQIATFKLKTNELKTTIPETFNGIASKVSEHFTKITSTIISNGGKLTSNTRAVFQNAVAAATGVLTAPGTISKFYNAGKQAAAGYVNGIKSQAGSVKTASSQLGNNSAKTVKQVLGIKSPSRVFMEIGEYAGEGYVVGLQSYMGAVDTASKDLSQSSIDGVYRVVDAVQNAVSEGMDLTPTITPVFDSMNVQNGLGDVNAMMDLSQRDIASISANIDAKASYDNSQVEAMQNRMDMMRTAFNDLADILNNQETPTVNANVILQGDADGVFKLVQNSNNRYTKMHGRSAFA